MIEQILETEKQTFQSPREFEKPNDKKQIHVVCITSFPGRECGIATFSRDLRESILSVFGDSIKITICAIDNPESNHSYDYPVEYILDAKNQLSYKELAEALNQNEQIDSVFIQHEFGLFGGEFGDHLLHFLRELAIPVVTTFHTVLPNPCNKRKSIVQTISEFSDQVIVMTNNSSKILKEDYHIDEEKLAVIPHGTHLISLKDKEEIKERYFLKNKKVLTTFGLLNSGKSIETALFALPEILKENPDCMYLIIGKTHPEVLKKEGEKYREYLYQIIEDLKIGNHVLFIDKFVSNEELLEFLQMTDIYLFTSKDPFQAVSGTFSYAMGCNCPIISTQIPHALDSLENAGIIIDFNDSNQLSQSANYLFRNPDLLNSMRINALEKIKPSSWQNVAIRHMNMLKNRGLVNQKQIDFQIPEYNINHIDNLTNHIGIIQFSKAEIPDIESGFTLDDNARALIAVTEYYELTGDVTALPLITTYLNFIEYMQQEKGDFLNYLDKYGFFGIQNFEENLEDSNGRAIWALGYFYSKKNLFQNQFNLRVEDLIENSLQNIPEFTSPRAMAFSLKGLYYFNEEKNSIVIHSMILDIADKLLRNYYDSSDEEWKWYENKLTYGNAILPEALLFAYRISRREEYLNIAKESFDFLLSILFENEHFKTISNRSWFEQYSTPAFYGEQPIEVSYTISALEKFNSEYEHERYDEKMKKAFDWYQGDNHLKQIVYNPLTGGCCDGVEHDRVNLNQGAESTITYLMARNSIEKLIRKKDSNQINIQ